MSKTRIVNSTAKHITMPQGTATRSRLLMIGILGVIIAGIWLTIAYKKRVWPWPIGYSKPSDGDKQRFLDPPVPI